MAISWKGGAAAVAQVNTYAFAGTWEATDETRVQIGGRVYWFTAGSTIEATVIDNLIAEWLTLDDDDYPEFAEITPSRSGDNLILTAATPGVPFVATLAPFESDFSTAGDAQTIEGANTPTTGTATTASAGPHHWDTAENWSGGAVPANADDVVIENSSVSIKYGLAQSSVALASLTIKASFTGQVGLPKTNKDGAPYPENRADYLAIRPGTLRIGDGDGEGSQRLKIDTGTDAAATIVVVGTGSRVESDVPALLLKGANASNSFTMLKGDAGVAIYQGETSNLSGLCRVGSQDSPDSDVTLFLGTGVTLGTVTQNGGTVTYNSNVTTLNVNQGEARVMQGTVDTLNVLGGKCTYNSTGTLTTAIVGGDGHLDFSEDPRGPKTVTNPIDLHGEEARLSDPYQVVGSLVVDVNYRNLGERHRLNIGTHLRLTRGTPA